MAAVFFWQVSWLLAVAVILAIPATGARAQQTQPAVDQREFQEVRLRFPLPPPILGLPINPPPEVIQKYNIPRPRRGPRPPLMAPRGATNLALRRPVTSSTQPTAGNLACINGGDSNALADRGIVELPPGLQWVQIDLGQPCEIWGILFWQLFDRPRAYKCVVVQIADDKDFTANVRTLFNNDTDNAAGFGAGRDPMYFETFMGNLIATDGVKARYVRLYSNGNTHDDKNHFLEVAVYGLRIHDWVEIALPAGKMPLGLPKKPPTEVSTYIESARKGPRPLFKAPRGTTNLALHRPVASSTEPVHGELKQITDGTYYGLDNAWVEFEPGIQWIQIDLGKPCEIWGILVWHSLDGTQFYKSVVVQVSDDEHFRTSVTTVFNNDHENRVGQGKGKDRLYIEQTNGRLIATEGIRARHVRLYSTGSVHGNASRWTEVQVYGLSVD